MRREQVIAAVCVALLACGVWLYATRAPDAPPPPASPPPPPVPVAPVVPDEPTERAGGLFTPGVPPERVEMLVKVAWFDGLRTGIIGGLIAGGFLGLAAARLLREERRQ